MKRMMRFGLSNHITPANSYCPGWHQSADQGINLNANYASPFGTWYPLKVNWGLTPESHHVRADTDYDGS